jgi:hypothetical protein
VHPSIVSIDFRANLDAQNAGNGISELQISNIFWGNILPDPLFMRGMLATHVAFGQCNCYPPLIYYLTERSLFKKCHPPLPPMGKSLKKALKRLGTHISQSKTNTNIKNRAKLNTQRSHYKTFVTKRFKRKPESSNNIFVVLILR